MSMASGLQERLAKLERENEALPGSPRDFRSTMMLSRFIPMLAVV
jgi:hypothetical protein